MAEFRFPDNLTPIGEVIRINGIPFQIIGVMAEKGGSLSNQDNAVFVPLTTAQSRLFSVRSPSGEYSLSSISVQAVSEDRMEMAKGRFALSCGSGIASPPGMTTTSISSARPT